MTSNNELQYFFYCSPLSAATEKTVTEIVRGLISGGGNGGYMAIFIPAGHYF